jgi:hypothetical protein
VKIVNDRVTGLKTGLLSEFSRENILIVRHAGFTTSSKSRPDMKEIGDQVTTSHAQKV